MFANCQMMGMDMGVPDVCLTPAPPSPVPVPTVMGPSRHLTGAFTVLLSGMPATRLTSVALQNSTNCPGVRVVPSQALVLMLAP
jgi:hypothetical protein